MLYEVITTTTPSISAQISSTTLSSRFKTAAIVEGVISQAFCMAMARWETNFSPSSKLKAPLATKAERNNFV